MLTKILRNCMLFVPVLGFAINAKGQCTINCPGNMTVYNAPGLCGANVTFTVTSNCPVVTTPASGSFFPVGTTTVTSTANSANGSASCSFTVTVVDNEKPRITNVSANPNTLWPPNHKMRDVMVNYNVADNCPGPITCGLTVTSNEPVNDIGDGNTAPDWIVIDNHRVQLRAERAGPLNGRIYTIAIGCRDANTNITTTNATVVVPHDQGNRKYSNLRMSVSPNPSSSSFTLNVTTDDPTSKINVTVSNLQGTVVETKNNINPKQMLTMGAGLRAGTYIIKAQQGDAISETQVVKQ